MRFERAAAPTPTSTPTLLEAFVRLGALAGAKREDIASRLPDQRAQDWDAFEAALASTRPLLAPLGDRLGGSLLGRCLRDQRFDGEGTSPRYLPKEARAALKKGEVVATCDADVWIVDAGKEGARISHAHPESFEVLGDTIGEWLSLEIDALERPKKAEPSPEKSGKAAIDAALTKLAALSGADVAGALRDVAFPPDETKWKYLRLALAGAKVAWSKEVLDALDGRLLGRCLTGRLHDGDEAEEAEEGDDVDGINPVFIRRYPKEARKPMGQVRPTCYVASSGPEVWFILWQAGKGTISTWNVSVHHAAPDGYEVLGESLEAWLDGEVERAVHT